jgi:hypothetical protein
MGLNVQEQTFQGSAAANLASSLLTAINSASLEIPAREVDLLQDLRSLSLVEKSGVWRLVADRSSRGHADQAFALLAAISGAAVLASAGYSGPIEDICPKAVEHPTFLQQNFAARGVLVDNRRRHLSSVIRPQQRGDPRIERTAGLFPRRN